MFYNYFDMFGNRRGMASSKSEATKRAMQINDYIKSDMSRKYKEALIQQPNLTFKDKTSRVCIYSKGENTLLKLRWSYDLIA